MQERVKVFTYVSGEGSTILESGLEEHINAWLAQVKGKLVDVRQSESPRGQRATHVTVCIWYVPEQA